MAKINKPNYQVLWASSGAITAPDDTKKQTGWVVEKPPYQYDNWLENRQDTAIAHILQHGIPEWDNVTEFQANASYTNRSGIVYKCKQTHTNQDPSLDVTNVYWERAFDTFGSSATVQSNLSAHIANYINGSGINAPNFRTSLGLGNAATSTIQSSVSDATVNRLMLVGAFGLGASTLTTTNFDTLTANGFYQGTDAVGTPSAGVNIVVQHIQTGSSFAYQIASRVSANRIWHRYKSSGTWDSWVGLFHTGNDGAGSGLDADLLDGQQGSYYLPASSYADSGWLSPTLVNSFTQGANPLRYRKVGKTVHIAGLIQRTSTPSYLLNITTLPAGYRPDKEMYMPVGVAQDDPTIYTSTGTVIVGTDGTVRVGLPLPSSGSGASDNFRIFFGGNFLT